MNLFIDTSIAGNGNPNNYLLNFENLSVSANKFQLGISQFRMKKTFTNINTSNNEVFLIVETQKLIHSISGYEYDIDGVTVINTYYSAASIEANTHQVSIGRLVESDSDDAFLIANQIKNLVSMWMSSNLNIGQNIMSQNTTEHKLGLHFEFSRQSTLMYSGEVVSRLNLRNSLVGECFSDIMLIDTLSFETTESLSFLGFENMKFSTIDEVYLCSNLFPDAISAFGRKVCRSNILCKATLIDGIFVVPDMINLINIQDKLLSTLLLYVTDVFGRNVGNLTHLSSFSRNPSPTQALPATYYDSEQGNSYLPVTFSLLLTIHGVENKV